MQTYWLLMRKGDQSKSDGSSGSSDNDDTLHWFDIWSPLPEPDTDPLRLNLTDQNQRLADWNSNQLLNLLNRVVVQRKLKAASDNERTDDKIFIENAHQRWAGDGLAIIDEMKEYIVMPPYDPKTFPKNTDKSELDLPEPVIQQLHGK